MSNAQFKFRVALSVFPKVFAYPVKMVSISKIQHASPVPTLLAVSTATTKLNVCIASSRTIWQVMTAVHYALLL